MILARAGRDYFDSPFQYMEQEMRRMDQDMGAMDREFSRMNRMVGPRPFELQRHPPSLCCCALRAAISGWHPPQHSQQHQATSTAPAAST
jgi:hypothetical protein